ncbi:recombinase family protein [Amycolatopsis sp. NPDC049691]|uniref:recombinase family protein n=1 Tax=Amycolatopsis sp. NPDC049691 TaxID=3155155 RepID=UPI0034452779
MRWIFQQRATGRSVAGIARELNDRGFPCPSSADRDPRHEWIVRTVVLLRRSRRERREPHWTR